MFSAGTYNTNMNVAVYKQQLYQTFVDGHSSVRERVRHQSYMIMSSKTLWIVFKLCYYVTMLHAALVK